jgi:streptogramin lyase
VAYRRALFLPTTVRTSGYPHLDSAPGGTLDSFDIAAQALTSAGQDTEAFYPVVNSVPAVSAVAVRDFGSQADLFIEINELPPGSGELDEYLCASDSQAHTLITTELGRWIIDRLPLG